MPTPHESNENVFSMDWDRNMLMVSRMSRHQSKQIIRFWIESYVCGNYAVWLLQTLWDSFARIRAHIKHIHSLICLNDILWFYIELKNKIACARQRAAFFICICSDDIHFEFIIVSIYILSLWAFFDGKPIYIFFSPKNCKTFHDSPALFLSCVCISMCTRCNIWHVMEVISFQVIWKFQKLALKCGQFTVWMHV